MLDENLNHLTQAVEDAKAGQVTNARKLEMLLRINEAARSHRLSKGQLESVSTCIEKTFRLMIQQGAPAALRWSIAVTMCEIFTESSLRTAIEVLLQDSVCKKTTMGQKTASLNVIAHIVHITGDSFASVALDVFHAVNKHLKANDPGVRVNALDSLCQIMRAIGVPTSSNVAIDVWKHLLKCALDKDDIIRRAGAKAVVFFTQASPMLAVQHADHAIQVLLKAAVVVESQPETRFAFAEALGVILAHQVKVGPKAQMPARTGWDTTNFAKKKTTPVTDYASAILFLDLLGKADKPGLRPVLCITHLTLAQQASSNPQLDYMMTTRALFSLLPNAPLVPWRTSDENEVEAIERINHVRSALSFLLRFTDHTGQVAFIEQSLFPFFRAEDPSVLLCALDVFIDAVELVGEEVKDIAKLTHPVLHLVSNVHPLVQLKASAALRSIALASHSILFESLSTLLSAATVAHAEVLGNPAKTLRESTASPHAPQLRILFGHVAALASLASVLSRHISVPQDLTNGLLSLVKAMLDPHGDPTATLLRKGMAFLLLDGLMGLGVDWVGQRLTILFSLWRGALGKKTADQIKAIYTHVPERGRTFDELIVLYLGLCSLLSFIRQCKPLLKKMTHLHKIIIVFLTNVSQLLCALPHPTSAEFREKDSEDLPAEWPIVTLSGSCSIGDILLALRGTMFECFTHLDPIHYGARFTPLLNMLYNDVSRRFTSGFPVADFIETLLPSEDQTVLLDQAESQHWKLRSSDFSPLSAGNFFDGVKREAPGGSASFCMPWTQMSHPPEWYWRRRALDLIATIMTAGVGDAARIAVISNLLKLPNRTNRAERLVAFKAILHAVPVDTSLLEFFFDTLRDGETAWCRQLAVDLLAHCYKRHEPALNVKMDAWLMENVTSPNAAARASVALFCGAAMRVRGARELTVDSIEPLMHTLLRLAKETSQPVRSWMLHGLNLAIQACGRLFAPYFKDTLRLCVAHLVSDMFHRPVLYLALAQVIKHAAGALPLDREMRREPMTRILLIWECLKKQSLTGAYGPGVLTEAACLGTLDGIGLFASDLGPFLSYLKHCLNMSKCANTTPQCIHAQTAVTIAAVCPNGLPSSWQREMLITALFKMLEVRTPTDAAVVMFHDAIRVLLQGCQDVERWISFLRNVCFGGAQFEETITDKETKKEEDEEMQAVAVDAQETSRWNTRSATKLFAFRCGMIFLEQRTRRALSPVELDILISFGAQAAGSDIDALIRLGLQFLALVLRLNATVNLAVYEAQLTSVVRKSLQPGAHPINTVAAVDLLFEMLIADISTSPERLIQALIAPLHIAPGSTLVANPPFSERACTVAYISRLQCVCKLYAAVPALRVDVTPVLRNTLPLVLRDCVALLSNIQSHSIKKYAPFSFNSADALYVSGYYRDALTSFFRALPAIVDTEGGGQKQAVLVVGLVVLRMGRDAHCDSGMIDALTMMIKTHRVVGSVLSSAMLFEALRAIWRKAWAYNRPELCPSLLALCACVCSHEWFNAAPREELMVHGAAFFHWVLVALQRSPRGFQENPDVMVNAMDVVVWLVEHFSESGIVWSGASAHGKYEKSPARIPRSISWRGTEHSGSNDGRSEHDHNVDVVNSEDAVSSPLKVEDGGYGARQGVPKIGSEESIKVELPVSRASEQQDASCFGLWLLYASPFPSQLVDSHPALTQKCWKRVCQILAKTQSMQRHKYLTDLAEFYAIPLVNAAIESGNQQSVARAFALLIPLLAAVCDLDGALHPDVSLSPPTLMSALAHLLTASFCATDVAQTAIASFNSLLALPTLPKNKLIPLLPAIIRLIGHRGGQIDAQLWHSIRLMNAHSTKDAMRATTLLVLQVCSTRLLCLDGKPSAKDFEQIVVACVTALAQSGPAETKEGMNMLPPAHRQALENALRAQATLKAASQVVKTSSAPKIELKMKFG